MIVTTNIVRTAAILSWLARLSVLCLLFTNTETFGQNTRVQLVYNNNDNTHQTYVARLKSELEQKITGITYLESSANQLVRTNSLAEADLYISIGVDAAVAIGKLSPKRPTLFTLLPTQHVPDSKTQQSSGCYPDCIYAVLDQPVKRQLKLIQHALPGYNSIGVLYADDSAAMIKPLQQAATTHNLKLLAFRQSAEQSLHETLSPIVSDTQLLLALPDPGIYNKQTARSIILLTYRHRIPIIGYSDAYTRAGALLSLFSTPEDFARHNAEMLATMINERKSPAAIVYPRYFNVSVNQTVARSLDIDLDTGAALTDWLRKNDDFNTNY